MPSGRSVIPKPLVQVYNQLIAKRKLQKEYGLPLVEFGIELRSKSGEKRELTGFVPEGLKRDKAIKLVVEQNNGSCNIEQGGYDPVNKIDLSEFTWIKHIALSDGFKVEDWLQIRDRNGEFEIGSANGKSFWENANTKNIGRYDNRIMITEDYGMTAELPDTDKLIAGEKKACGGCGGAIGEDTLELAKGIAGMKIERDAEYTINLDTGRIREKTPLKFMEFDYKPEEISLQNINVNIPSFNLTRNEQQNTMDAGIFTDNKQLRLHEFAELDAVYVCTKALRDEVHVEATSAQVITDTNEVAVPQTNQNKFEFKQEESMIIRLLMNPVERKLWGKLYGLPDDEEIRKSNEIKKKENAAPEKIKIKQSIPKPVEIRPPKRLVHKKENPENTKPEKIKLQEIKQTPGYTPKAVARREEPRANKIPVIPAGKIKAEKKKDAPPMIIPRTRKKKKPRREFIVKETTEKKIAQPKQKMKKHDKISKKTVDTKKEMETEKGKMKKGKKPASKKEIPERKPKVSETESKPKKEYKVHASFSKKKKRNAKPAKKGRDIANYLLTEDIRHLFGKQPWKEVQQECN